MGTQIHSTMKFERPTQAQRQLEWGTRAEEEVRASLDCLEVHDLRWGKGLKNFWKFVTDDDSEATQKA